MQKNQLFLYKIQPVRPAMLTEGATPEENEFIDLHFKYLKSLTEQGVSLMVGRTLNTDYSSFGLMVFQAVSESQAWEIANQDPGVKGKVFRAEIFPFRIALLGSLQEFFDAKN